MRSGIGRAVATLRTGDKNVKSTFIRIGAMTTVVAGVAALTSSFSGAASAATSDAGPILAPYYTQLDVTGDQQVTVDDLAVAAAALGITETSPQWSALSALDTDADG